MNTKRDENKPQPKVDNEKKAVGKIWNGDHYIPEAAEILNWQVLNITENATCLNECLRQISK